MLALRDPVSPWPAEALAPEGEPRPESAPSTAPRLAETDGDAPQSRQPFYIFLALVVPDPHAFAAGDHHRSGLEMRLEVGVGVQRVGDVAGGGGIGPGLAHGSVS